jgi:DNA-binding SARP family transcriptional activator
VLVNAVWADERPGGSGHALHSLISRLRRLLPGRIEADTAGYRLAVESTDVADFERLVAQGRVAASPTQTEAALAAALGLWRGEPLADLSDVEPTRARVYELRLQAAEDLAEARIAVGDAAAALAELGGLVEQHPLRERLHLMRLRALRAVGRPADALVAYERIRRTLAEELGADPSPALRALHAELLRGEASDVARRTNLRPAPNSFIGRDTDSARLDALLSDQRLVTLVGPGGAGKTRVAVEVARGWVDRLADGAFMVELAAIRGRGDQCTGTAALRGPRRRGPTRVLAHGSESVHGGGTVPPA